MNAKLCECGCGLPAPIARVSRPKQGHRVGEPTRFIKGHYRGSGHAIPREPFIGPLEPGTRMIPLTKGYFAKVDECDYDRLMRINWHYRQGYASWTNRTDPSAQKATGMHRYIMNTPEGMHTDHINGDRLDNRRANLRICTQGENNRNMNRDSRGTSRFTGVYFDKRIGKWRAAVRANGKRHHLGCFCSEVEAVKVRDAAARRLHGEYARTNQIEANL